MPYQCTECDQSYTRKDNLSRHMLRVHQEESDDDQKDSDDAMSDSDSDESSTEYCSIEAHPWLSVLKAAITDGDFPSDEVLTEAPHLHKLVQQLGCTFSLWKRTVDALEGNDEDYAKIKARIARFQKDGFSEEEAIEAGWAESSPVVKGIIKENMALIDEEEEEQEEEDESDTEVE